MTEQKFWWKKKPNQINWDDFFEQETEADIPIPADVHLNLSLFQVAGATTLRQMQQIRVAWGQPCALTFFQTWIFCMTWTAISGKPGFLTSCINKNVHLACDIYL